MAECVDGVFSLIGGDGAGELSFVEVQAQISGGDLALGADLEASQRQASTVDPEVVIAIYRQAVVIIIVTAEVQ